MCQPDLDFMAPENQSSSACSPQSDMFSLGLLICSVYNNGRSPIQSNFSTTGYFKQLETVRPCCCCRTHIVLTRSFLISMSTSIESHFDVYTLASTLDNSMKKLFFVALTLSRFAFTFTANSSIAFNLVLLTTIDVVLIPLPTLFDHIFANIVHYINTYRALFSSVKVSTKY